MAAFETREYRERAQNVSRAMQAKGIDTLVVLA